MFVTMVACGAKPLKLKLKTWPKKIIQVCGTIEFHFTQDENVMYGIHTKNSNCNCNSYCSLTEAFKVVTVGMDKAVNRTKPGPSFLL
jgi:hypothetical protein